VLQDLQQSYIIQKFVPHVTPSTQELELRGKFEKYLALARSTAPSTGKIAEKLIYSKEAVKPAWPKENSWIKIKPFAWRRCQEPFAPRRRAG